MTIVRLIQKQSNKSKRQEKFEKSKIRIRQFHFREIRKKENDYSTRIKWLAGQALEGTLSMGCPHGVIHSFAEKFEL